MNFHKISLPKPVADPEFNCGGYKKNFMSKNKKKINKKYITHTF